MFKNDCSNAPISSDFLSKTTYNVKDLNNPLTLRIVYESIDLSFFSESTNKCNTVT